MLVPEEFLYCHQASIWVVTQCNVHQTAKRARFLSWGLQCQPVLGVAGHVRNQSPNHKYGLCTVLLSPCASTLPYASC